MNFGIFLLKFDYSMSKFIEFCFWYSCIATNAKNHKSESTGHPIGKALKSVKYLFIY